MRQSPLEIFGDRLCAYPMNGAEDDRAGIAGTPDAEFQERCAEVGPERTAAEYVDNCPKEDERNAWFFELGYDDGDNLVGLTMPVTRTFPRSGRSKGCIYMIGVLPEMRGQRFIDDLLAQGTGVLEREGADWIISDY